MTMRRRMRRRKRRKRRDKERGLFLSNTFFQHKMIHRYTWARGNERSMIDYIAVDNRLRREVEDAKVVRGLFSDSDHFVVVVKVRMRETWEFKGNGRKEGERRELASERLRNSEDSQRYGRKVEEFRVVGDYKNYN